MQSIQGKYITTDPQCQICAAAYKKRNAARICPNNHTFILNTGINEEKPTERLQGITAGLNILLECGALIVGTRYGISEGMKTEIEWAQRNNITIIWILGGVACYTR